jgi:hypothetical protein
MAEFTPNVHRDLVRNALPGPPGRKVANVADDEIDDYISNATREVLRVAGEPEELSDLPDDLKHYFVQLGVAMEQEDYETWGRLMMPLTRAVLQASMEHFPGLAGEVAVVEEHFPVLDEDPTSITVEELRRSGAAINHLIREQRKALQGGA